MAGVADAPFMDDRKACDVAWSRLERHPLVCFWSKNSQRIASKERSADAFGDLLRVPWVVFGYVASGIGDVLASHRFAELAQGHLLSDLRVLC